MGLEDEARNEIAEQKRAEQAKAAEDERLFHERNEAVRPMLAEFVEIARKYRVKPRKILIWDSWVATWFGGHRSKIVTRSVWPLGYPYHIDADLELYREQPASTSDGEASTSFVRSRETIMDPNLETYVRDGAKIILKDLA